MRWRIRGEGGCVCGLVRLLEGVHVLRHAATTFLQHPPTLLLPPPTPPTHSPMHYSCFCVRRRDVGSCLLTGWKKGSGKISWLGADEPSGLGNASNGRPLNVLDAARMLPQSRRSQIFTSAQSHMGSGHVKGRQTPPDEEFRGDRPIPNDFGR